MRLSFLLGPRFVTQVGQALCRNPDLARRSPVSGAALLFRQARASALRFLHGNLLHLVELVNDTYVYEQAGAIKDARFVIDDFMRRLPDLSPDEVIDQGVDLEAAMHILDRAGEARREVWKRTRAKKGLSTDGRRRTKAESARARLEGQKILDVIREAVRRGLARDR